MAGAPRRAWVEQIMGMPISIHVRGLDVGSVEAEQAAEAVFVELRRVDAIFSTYRADSQVSRINRGELTIDAAAPDVQDVARLCVMARERTRGAFDAWLPLPHELSDVPAEHAGVSPQERRSTAGESESWGAGGARGTGGALTWFDPSGLVKGWAVERAARQLNVLTGHDFYINAGGDTVLQCAGPASPPWRVGIEDPDDPRGVRHVLLLRSGAVATSGSTHRGQHIVDPATGAAADGLRAATVVGPSLLWADVYATSAVVLGERAVAWVEGLGGYEAWVVGRAGSAETSGFAALSRPAGAPSSRLDGGRSTRGGPARWR